MEIVEEGELGLGVVDDSRVQADGADWDTHSPGQGVMNFLSLVPCVTPGQGNFVKTRILASEKESLAYVATKSISRSYMYLSPSVKDAGWAPQQW